MKRLQIILGLALLSFVLTAQTPHYFYNHKKERVYLSLNTRYAFLSVREQKLPTDIQQRNVRAAELRSDNSDRKQFQNRQGTSRFFTELNFEETMSDEQYLLLLSDIQNQNEGVVISPFFKIEEGDKIGLSNFFYVKLNEVADTTLLRQMAERTNTIIIEQDMFMPLWFVLSTTERSELNALENANAFFESGLFQAAEPDLMVDVRGCVSDPFFSQQWGLRNTGQSGGNSGIDIRACAAWEISTGRNVIVAIIDEGIEVNHPDLAANIHPLRFDCATRTISTTQQFVHGNHGVPVAGVVGALQNNRHNGNPEGISGVHQIVD
jgi:subtilisin family serine protease